MLVLSRKKGQSITIGDDIEIFVVGIEGDQVKIGIRAPSSVKVYRNEVLEAIRESNRDAVASPQSLQNLRQLDAETLNAIFKQKS
jgi:carbon storage regulator (csrA)